MLRHSIVGVPNLTWAWGRKHVLDETLPRLLGYTSSERPLNCPTPGVKFLRPFEVRILAIVFYVLLSRYIALVPEFACTMLCGNVSLLAAESQILCCITIALDLPIPYHNMCE
jgi:hypothetical protein